MKEFRPFLDAIGDSGKRERVESILAHISSKYPRLVREIKWNQPMFSDHGTFIIGFSLAAGHIAVAPESTALDRFEEEIAAAGYTRTKELMRIRWIDPVDLDLLDRVIEFNMEDKKDSVKFWR
ncbi:MAG TPA: DUF1801 domain-containing protein [Bacillota bacterium]|nr:DUF1801 domain-containing protein [Bacillota bacterium]